MLYFENAEQHPKFGENITCSVLSCGKVIAAKQPLYECSGCAKCFHPHCKGIVGQHITRKALDPFWFCSDACEKMLPEIGKSKSSNVKAKALSMTDVTSKLDKHYAEYSELKIMMSEIKESQNFMCNEFEKLREEYRKIADENKELIEIIKQNNQKNIKQKEHINRLEADIDEMQQKHIQPNLIIAGLPNETIDPKILVSNIFNVLGYSKAIDEVADVSYMKQKMNTNTSVDKPDKKLLITFKSVSTKYEVHLRKKHKMLHTNQVGFNQTVDQQIFFRDHLTAFRLRLYRQSQKLKKLINYKFLWINKSTIYFRKEEGARVIRISSQNDLDRISATHNIDPDILLN